jgi:hypothetical protein
MLGRLARDRALTAEELAALHAPDDGLSHYPPGPEWRMTNGERWAKLENDPAFKLRFEQAAQEHETRLAADPAYRAEHIHHMAPTDQAGRIETEALLPSAAGKPSVEIPRSVWNHANWVDSDVNADWVKFHRLRQEAKAKLKTVFDKYEYEMPTDEPDQQDGSPVGGPISTTKPQGPSVFAKKR